MQEGEQTFRKPSKPSIEIMQFRHRRKKPSEASKASDTPCEVREQKPCQFGRACADWIPLDLPKA